MKNKKIFKHAAIGTFLLTLSTGFLINYNLQKHYKEGDFIPEENAYFAGEIKEGGTIKAKKLVTPSDNKYSDQKTRSMGSEFIGNIESVWDTYTGAGTKIAIIDDGFDVDHPEYTRSDNSSAILPESRHYHLNNAKTSVVYEELSSYPNCLAEDWEEGEENGKTIYEWATHGTATSTTAAAPMGNGGGVGIAPDADILALKIDFTFASIEKAIYYAIEQGVDVINMSLGAYSESFTDGWGDEQSGSSSSRTYLENACKAAYDAGVIVVAAAGNEATWHKSYPACNYKVVGVGAIGDWDNKGNADVLAEFSNYVSTTQTGEINVDILAPGYVYTAEQTWDKISDKTSSTAPSKHGHTWADTQGTSFSSPIVAGAACLWKQKNPTGTPDQFLSDLQSTADGIGYYADKYIPVSGWYSELTDAGPSNITNGRLNVSRLLGTEAYVNLDETNMYLLKDHTKQIQITSSNGNITYKSNNTNVATVSNTGLVTAVGAGNTSITVTATVGTQQSTATVYVNVQDIVEATSLTFSQKSIDIAVGSTYNAEPLVTLTPANASRVFLFESENENVATVNEDTGEITGISEGTATINCVAMYGSGDDSLTVNVTASAAVSDTLTRETTGVSGTAYASWSGKEGESGAVYAGLSSGGNDSIQLKSKDSTSGIVTTTSGGIITEITVNWNSNTSGKTLDVYGKNTAYTSASNLYNSDTRGTLLGSIDSDTQTTLAISGNYAYVGVRSNNGALYMDSITFTWNGGSTPTPPTPVKTLSSISVSGQQTEFTTGDEFVFGGVVTAHYSDSTTADVTSAAVFSGYNMAVAGDYTVTASYTEGVTKTDSYQITVADVAPIIGDKTTVTYSITSKTAASVSDGTAPNGSTISFNNNGTNDDDQLTNGKRALWTLSGYEGYIITKIEVNLKRSSKGGNGAITLTNSSENVSLNISSTSSSNVSQTYAYKGVYSNDDGFVVNGEVALTITANASSLYCDSIKVTYAQAQIADKVISSLTASYIGGDLYVGQTIDTSKLTVTAKYTNSTKYPDGVLPSSDYQLSGFDSSSAGNKIVTVTYTGSTLTSTTPLTTTFNVKVIEDTITGISAATAKTYHPGETIDKADIVLTVNYLSGKQEHPTNFTFANDGYQFVYADAASGGASTNKTFTNSITYGTMNCSLTVQVSRNAHQSAVGVSDTLTRTTTGIAKDSSTYEDWEGKQVSSGAVYAGNSAGVNDSIQIRSNNSNSGIVMTASGGNVISVTVTFEVHTQNSRKLNIYGKNTAYSAATDLYNASTQGTLLGSITNGSSTTLVIDGSYKYIGLRSDSGAIFLTDITINIEGGETATNVANYIMFEDTENQCVSKLDTAITYFESMSKEERTLFMTSEDYVIATARERLEAWLANQEKQINIVDGDYVISNNYSTLSSLSESDNEVMVIVVTISFLTISLLTLVYLLRKKRKLI